jgi:hypothetical protein
MQPRPRHPGTLALLGLSPDADATLPQESKKHVPAWQYAIALFLAIPGSLLIPVAILGGAYSKIKRKR